MSTVLIGDCSANYVSSCGIAMIFSSRSIRGLRAAQIRVFFDTDENQIVLKREGRTHRSLSAVHGGEVLGYKLWLHCFLCYPSC